VAVAKYKIPKLESKQYRSWTFVVILGVLLALVAIIDRGGLDSVTADGSTGCQLEVNVDTLNVRSGPSPEASLVETLNRGTVVDGTNVVTDGFRELENSRWADDRYLTPVAGTNCS
jgi:hypothetical protein